MKYHLVAIRDIKTNSFGTVVQTPHLGSAIRQFGDQCTGKMQNGDPALRNHPEDFELYQLGFYDDSTGELSNEKTQIAIGSNFNAKG